MESDLAGYKAKLSKYSDEELCEIRNSLDRDKYPERATALLEEIDKRKFSAGFDDGDDSYEKSKYRTFARRGVAIFIDSFVLILGMIGFMSAFHSFGTPLQVASAYGTVGFLYNILFHWKKGATPGKAILRVKVLDNRTEQSLSLKQAVMRDIIPIAAYLISIPEIFFGSEAGFFSFGFGMAYQYWGLIEIFTALTNRKRRSLHDFVAKTVCIKLKPRTPAPFRR